ncbi:glycosyltransferase family 2 protein [Acidobacteria bacterium AH-259-D05]|nr:glycosyltransferase family 2 protein [Acidobacteria bacterium AH-259-D05]
MIGASSATMRNPQTQLGFSNKSTRPRVGVVLINWNVGELTIQCIQSLRAGRVKPSLVVVVDNASVDGSPDKIALTFPDVILIRNKVNKGFADSNNQGIEILLQQGIDYIWILNNDTVVAKDCLERLVKAATRNTTGACFSAKIFYMDPPDQLWYGGGYRHRFHLAPKHYLTPTLDRLADNEVVEVDFISGCCMFVPSHIFAIHGVFCSEYIAYSEDNEWCWRIRRKNEKIFYVPSAIMWHRLSASVEKNTGRPNESGASSLAWYLMIRNNLWTIRRHAKPISKKALSLMLSVFLTFKVMFNCLLNGDGYKITSLGKGIWHGFTKALPDICSFLTPEKCE